LFLGFSGSGVAAAADRRPQAVPLPRFPANGIELRLALLDTPRDSGIGRDELGELLAATKRTVLAHFGQEVSFSFIQLPPLNGYVKQVDERLEKKTKTQMARYLEPIDWVKVEAAVRRALHPSELSQIAAYVRRSEGETVNVAGQGGLTRFIARTLKERFIELTHVTLSDGKPLLSAMPSKSVEESEWVFWDNLGRLLVPVDVILTNQLVASVEYVNLAVHSSLRGGVSVGGTSYSRLGRFGTLSWMSLFPFLSPVPVMSAMRAGRDYERKEALTLAGAYLAHEIGHQLFHFGHPWENDACVMTPAVALDFAAWSTRLDSVRCAIGSSKAMTPGALKFHVAPPL
jgi:hypothetical protein